jgi:uncharacterized lipoprotein
MLVALLAPLLLCAGGCHSMKSKLSGNSCNKSQPYQAEKSVPPLQIPAGLDAPDTSNALKLPALKEPAPPPRTTKDPCLDVPPAYKVAKAPAPQA